MSQYPPPFFPYASNWFLLQGVLTVADGCTMSPCRRQTPHTDNLSNMFSLFFFCLCRDPKQRITRGLTDSSGIENTLTAVFSQFVDQFVKTRRLKVAKSRP